MGTTKLVLVVREAQASVACVAVLVGYCCDDRIFAMVMPDPTPPVTLAWNWYSCALLSVKEPLRRVVAVVDVVVTSLPETAAAAVVSHRRMESVCPLSV